MWGSGSELMYDGAVLASHGQVIVITFNYRLNIFGWFNHKSGKEEKGINPLYSTYCYY